jgi:hypothetical protein
MPAKEEHGSDSGSESLDKHVPRDMLHCHVERRDQSSAVAETSNPPETLQELRDALVYEWGQHPTSLYPTIDWFYASEMRSCCYCKRLSHTSLPYVVCPYESKLYDFCRFFFLYFCLQIKY